MIIDVRPEFGYELTCAVPYAYYLHTKGKLEKCIIPKGMKPFYYFCDALLISMLRWTKHTFVENSE